MKKTDDANLSFDLHRAYQEVQDGGMKIREICEHGLRNIAEGRSPMFTKPMWVKFCGAKYPKDFRISRPIHRGGEAGLSPSPAAGEVQRLTPPFPPHLLNGVTKGLQE